MTKSQINKLGDKLRSPGPIDEETLARLQAFRALFDAPMVKAQALLAEGLGIETTARLKTVNTIVEKLRREKTRLAEMQDIAGLRTVQEMSTGEQDALVEKIVSLLPGAEMVDRRKRPSHGYRALHVIATIDDCLVEIQVRTRMQDLWAQAMEKLADEAGREIRYGGVPESHAESVHKLKETAQRVATLEEMREEIRKLKASLPPARQAAVAQREIRLHQMKIRRLNEKLLEESRAVRAILDTMLQG